ncbi:UDP-glucose 4-epimerase [Cryptotermes secundus]|uniref:UDP-glucose 4-epimerase n=1 Tax=Cryptotermes secundus TaxID=105785 RepID=A0A2J7R5I0_9NEOP|nr:UDP-glucose 4-epimerase isoform X1 [Cryptotermes secundus]PNF36095.1 UDP-glucose 4-epimerase [Cryptotermes secundus]
MTGNIMSSWSTVFVTGGAGYIGSHCIVELLDAGYSVIAVDNFANSVNGERGEAPSLKRVERITGKTVTFYQCDLLDKPRLEKIFSEHKIDCVIHFAAMKAVGESMQVPLLYYKNNIVGTINLLEVMKTHGCYQLVFSSSCTVYGNPDVLPITEEHHTGNVTNVYGRTKYFIEEMLKDISAAEKNWNIICLRYFNPVGAHPSGLIGEDPTKAFTNLMPYMAQVAIGNRPNLTIFGGDYNTVDGTGVRDYIHVMDLASGHVAALNKLKKEHLRLKTYNLGTGQGVSVLQLLRTFEAVTKTMVPFEIQDRRTGDIVSMYANTSLAERELGWKAKYTLEQMCEDFWRWQTMNPNGYRGNSNNSASSENGRTSVIINGSELMDTDWAQLWEPFVQGGL